MLNFQAKQLCVYSSDILCTAEEALKCLDQFDYCIYLKKENVYPHLCLISAHDLGAKQLNLFLNHYEPDSLVFFKDTFQDYVCYSIPLTFANFKWIQQIFQSKPNFFEIQDTFSDLIHDLPKQFLSQHQNSTSFTMFQQLMAYSQYEAQSKHLWAKGSKFSHVEEYFYTQALQHILLNDPITPFFIQGTHRFVINDLLLESLKLIIKKEPDEIIHHYLQRIQQEEPHAILMNSYNDDIPLCAVFFETQQCSIFSEFEFRVFNALNELYKNQLVSESFKQRVKQDPILKDLYFPRYEQLQHLIHGENRWNITIQNSATHPANPYLDCWQSGLYFQPVHYGLKNFSSNKFHDPRLMTHILYLPYCYFQILVLYFNCLHNPRLINQLLNLIDNHLAQQNIQTVPSIIIDKIEHKYPEKSSYYLNINQKFYDTRVLPEIKHILLQHAKNILKKMMEENLPQASIPVYDRRFNSFTMIRLESSQPLSYLINETLKLENPECFHTQWVLNHLKSEFNQSIHQNMSVELIF